MKKWIFLALFLAVSVLLQAQDVLSDPARRAPVSGTKPQPSHFHQLEAESIQQVFEGTYNAAGMGLFQPASGSLTSLSGQYGKGDFRRAQEGDSFRGFTFSTLRYDRFNEWLFMRGSFHYSFDRETNRKWSDVRDPWLSNPFIYGSSVAKDYTSHQGGLSFDLYTAPLLGWISAGLRMKYEVDDISGLRDPRPRTQCLRLHVVPSVLFSIGAHQVGLDFGYGFDKEKLNNLTTIQSYPNLYYYRMSGVGFVEGTIGGYGAFKRQFEGHRGLGDLSWGYASGALRMLVSGGAEYFTQNVLGDKKQSPGAYNEWTYRGRAEMQITSGKYLHRVLLNGQARDGGADEYLQELQSTHDERGVSSENWVTLYTYRNRYMVKTGRVEGSYSLYGGFNGKDYLWRVSGSAGWSMFSREHFLPYSNFGAVQWHGSLSGLVRVLELNGHRLELSLDVATTLRGKVWQELYQDNLYVQEVLLPDRDYYSRHHLDLSGDITWTFPLNLGKAGLANGFVRFGGEWIRAFPKAQWYQLALSVGLFTF